MKKKEVERDQVSIQSPDTLLERTPEGSPSPHPITWVMAFRGLGQILIVASQPQLVWLCKQDRATVLL